MTVEGVSIRLGEIGIAILVIAERLVADRRTSHPTGSGREQRQSCSQGDLEALVIQWWDRSRATSLKLSKNLKDLQKRGLLEPSIVRADMRLHAWRLTDLGKGYLSALRAYYSQHLLAVAREVNPDELALVTGVMRKLTDAAWSEAKKACGVKLGKTC